MTREEARKAAEVMLAYANGKEVEGLDRHSGKYKQITSPAFYWMNNPDCYRIKPEPKYRPFKDAEECWQEMQKHQPLGWVRYTEVRSLLQVSYLCDNCVAFNNGALLSFEIALQRGYTFADGTPFGIEEGGEE